MTDEIGKGIQNSLEIFSDAVDRVKGLQIIGVEDDNGKDILVVENEYVDAGINGHQCTVEVTEIFAKVKDCKTAQEFIDVILGNRNPIVCEGVTRIVGYYSRVNNWNKSKIGELRDRQKGQYGTEKHVKEYHKESVQAVNSLST